MGIVKISVTGDSVAPTVSITSPLGGSVSGNVLVKASASDNVGVTSVTFFDGATQIGSDDTASPYRGDVGDDAAANGSHTLTAIARDAAGHATTSAAVVVNVNNVVTVTRARRRRPDAGAAAQAGDQCAGLVADVTSANSPSAPIGTVLDPVARWPAPASRAGQPCRWSSSRSAPSCRTSSARRRRPRPRPSPAPA